MKKSTTLFDHEDQSGRGLIEVNLLFHVSKDLN